MRYQIMAAKRAPSVIRSQLASSVAPNFVAPPLKRAIVPSTMSKAAKIPENTAAAKRWPLGIRVTVIAIVTKVPMSVTELGVRPTLRNPRATGSTTTAAGLRPCTLSTGVLHSRSLHLAIVHLNFLPTLGKDLPGIFEQLRQDLCAIKDSHKVAITSPPRHHVHVKVVSHGST